MSAGSQINWDQELGQQKPGINWDKELTPVKPTKEALESHTGEEALNYGFTPRNIAHNVATGIGELAGGAGAIAADLGKNKNWVFGDKMHPSTLEKYILPGMEEQSKKAAETSGLESFGHAVASGIPLIGPWAAGLGEQATHGDVGGALTKGAAQSIGPKLLSDAAKISTDVPAATASGIGKGLKAAAPLVHGVTSRVADVVDPDLVGIVSPRAANVLRTAGKVAKATEPYAKGTAPVGPEEIPFASAAPVSRLALPRGPIIRPEPEPVEEPMLREPKTQIVRGKGGRMTKQFLTGEAEPGEKAVLPGQQEPAFAGPGAEVNKPLVEIPEATKAKADINEAHDKALDQWRLFTSKMDQDLSNKGIDVSAFENAPKPTFTTEGGAGQNYTPEDLAALKSSLASRYGAAEPGPLAGEERPLVDTTPLTKGEEPGKITGMKKDVPEDMSRRNFLRRAGQTAIGAAVGGKLPLGEMAKTLTDTSKLVDTGNLVPGLLDFARRFGPDGADDEELEELGLLNPEGVFNFISDEIVDGEHNSWDIDQVRVARKIINSIAKSFPDIIKQRAEEAGIEPNKLIEENNKEINQQEEFISETPKETSANTEANEPLVKIVKTGKDLEEKEIQQQDRESLERQGEASESINNKLFYKGNKPGYNPLIAGEGVKETPNKAPWGGLFSPEKGRTFEPGVGPGAMKGEPPKLVEVPTEGMWPKPRTGFIGKVTKVIPSEEEGMEIVSFTKPDGEAGIINLPEGTVNEGDELRPRGATPAATSVETPKTSGLRGLPKPQDAKKLIDTGVDRDVENAVAGKKNLVEMPEQRTPRDIIRERLGQTPNTERMDDAIDTLIHDEEMERETTLKRLREKFPDFTNGEIKELHDRMNSIMDEFPAYGPRKSNVEKIQPKGTEPGDIRVPLDQVGFKKSDIPGFTQVGVVEPKTNSIHVYEVPNEVIDGLKKQGYVTIKGGFGNEDHVIKPGENPPKKTEAQPLAKKTESKFLKGSKFGLKTSSYKNIDWTEFPAEKSKVNDWVPGIKNSILWVVDGEGNTTRVPYDPISKYSGNDVRPDHESVMGNLEGKSLGGPASRARFMQEGGMRVATSAMKDGTSEGWIELGGTFEGFGAKSKPLPLKAEAIDRAIYIAQQLPVDSLRIDIGHYRFGPSSKAKNAFNIGNRMSGKQFNGTPEQAVNFLKRLKEGD